MSFTIRTIDGITKLSGKVDSSNAAEFEQQLRSVSSGALTLDFSHLKYISSAILRILLSLAKEKGEGLRLVNVPDDIYKVFEETDFTSIMNISRKPRCVQIDGCELIGEGALSTLYRLDDETIVKVFNAEVSDVLIERELECSHHALRYGIPTAIAFDEVIAGGKRGIVYELLRAPTLAKRLGEQPEEFEMLLEKMTALLKRVHSTAAKEGDFPKTSDIYQGYLDYVSKWYTASEQEALSRLLSSIPQRGTLVHGDFHAKNIMVVKGELALVDMSDMSIGNPFFDLVGITSAYIQFPSLYPEVCQKVLGMTRELAMRVHARLLELYFDVDDEELEGITTCLKEYMMIKYIFSPAFGSLSDEEIARITATAKHTLIPKIDEIIEKNKEIVERYF